MTTEQKIIDQALVRSLEGPGKSWVATMKAALRRAVHETARECEIVAIPGLSHSARSRIRAAFPEAFEETK